MKTNYTNLKGSSFWLSFWIGDQKWDSDAEEAHFFWFLFQSFSSSDWFRNTQKHSDWWMQNWDGQGSLEKENKVQILVYNFTNH